MSRTLVIGDIHGAHKALIQVLERAGVQKKDTLVFLGDYVDGWSESVAVLDELIALSRKHTCIFLRGNHDDLVHQWMLSGKRNDKWLQHGGQTTIDGYEQASDEQLKAHVQFFELMQDYYIDDENRAYFHAGFANQNGPKFEWYSKTFYWDRTLWEMVVAMDKNLSIKSPYFPKRLQHFKEIFIGHTPTTRLGEIIPMNRANVWNIDTGAAFKGPLTVMDVHSKKYWQSDLVYSMYPNEDGRNV